MENTSEGRKCCCFKLPMLVSGVILALIALVHVLKIFLGWEVMINGEECPTWASIITILITGGAAAWNFAGCCCKRCRAECQKMPPMPPL